MIEVGSSILHIIYSLVHFVIYASSRFAVPDETTCTFSLRCNIVDISCCREMVHGQVLCTEVRDLAS